MEKTRTVFYSQIDQTPLGLPSRDYFLQKESEKDLEAYQKYMTDVAVLLGANRSYAEQELGKVVEFERNLSMVKKKIYFQVTLFFQSVTVTLFNRLRSQKSIGSTLAPSTRN